MASTNFVGFLHATPRRLSAKTSALLGGYPTSESIYRREKAEVSAETAEDSGEISKSGHYAHLTESCFPIAT